MRNSRNEIVKYGVSFGTALAIAISWSANESVLWAILHGFFILVLCYLACNYAISVFAGAQIDYVGCGQC